MFYLKLIVKTSAFPLSSLSPTKRQCSARNLYYHSLRNPRRTTTNQSTATIPKVASLYLISRPNHRVAEPLSPVINRLHWSPMTLEEPTLLPRRFRVPFSQSTLRPTTTAQLAERRCFLALCTSSLSPIRRGNPVLCTCYFGLKF